MQEYGRFNQHIALLEDQTRVRAFLTAIGKSKPGEIVVDVGAGTGVWALTALQRGYEHAILIEPSTKMCRYASHLAELNGLSDRITIIPKPLEAVASDELPSDINLLISETLSSVIFGFGSWDTLPQVSERVVSDGAIVPHRGRLWASLVDRDLSKRGADFAGLKLLKDIGLRHDIFEVTFRSGGNIWDKTQHMWNVLSGVSEAKVIASFDFGSEHCMQFNGANLVALADQAYSGVVLHWDVDLLSDGAVRMSSLDPNLTSWAPLYVPFISPKTMARGETLHCTLSLEPVDNPYKYAIRLKSHGNNLSERLYW